MLKTSGEIIGDLRGWPNAGIEVAQQTFGDLGYVAIGPEGCLPSGFREKVLPVFRHQLRNEMYPEVNPQGRERASAFVTFATDADGTIRLNQDFDEVPIPFYKGNDYHHPQPRIYPNGLPILGIPEAVTWHERLAQIACPRLEGTEGSMIMHYFRTGPRTKGKVVSGPHADGGQVVVSAPIFIEGGVAPPASSLYLPGNKDPLATFRLKVGQVLMNDDEKLLHDVGPLPLLPNGEAATRETWIVIFLKDTMHRLIQGWREEGRVSREPATPLP